MVRALLVGHKTQTRRTLTPQPDWLPEVKYTNNDNGPFFWPIGSLGQQCGSPLPDKEVRFAVGDRLYVREEYYQFGHWEAVEGASTKGGKQKWAFVGSNPMVQFDAPSEFLVSRDKEFPHMPRWYKRLGRFMPRSLSRMTLIVTDVRVERLQDCSEADAIAEGIIYENVIVGAHGSTGTHIEITADRYFDPSLIDDEDEGHEFAADAYAALWDHINGEGAWEENPWVVAVSFDVTKGNIDG
tara:strand:- start:3704 stop:4426 length:723 start_codon:yes stop_codon:yes gene_type:complete